MEKVVAVVLAHNEKNSIKKTMKILNKHKKNGLIHQVVVVNDGSTDGTVKIARKYGATVVSHENNMGKRKGFITGAFTARNAGASTMLLFDADLVNLPEETVRKMISNVSEKKHMVIASQHEMTDSSRHGLRKKFSKVESSSSNAQRAFNMKGLEPLFKNNKKWNDLLNAKNSGSIIRSRSNNWGLEAALDKLVPENRIIYIKNPVYTLTAWRKEGIDSFVQGNGKGIVYGEINRRRFMAREIREFHKKIWDAVRRNDFRTAENLKKTANKIYKRRK